MSGPKGYNVKVAADERRRQAKIAAQNVARARCSALLGQRNDMIAEAAALGDALPIGEGLLVVDTMGLDDLQRTQALLERELSQLQGLVQAARATATRRSMASLLEDWVVDVSDLPRVEALLENRSDTADRGTRVRASLDRCINRIAALDEATRPQLVERSNQVLRLLADGLTAEADLALLDLQSRTETEAKVQHARDSVQRDGAALAVVAADLPGTAGAAIRSRALACTTREELAAVAAAEVAERQRIEAEHDRAFIISQTCNALRELGYEIGAEPSVIATSGSLVARKPDLPDHGLELSFTPNAPRMLSRVVAFADTSPTRDAEVERITCADLEHLSDELGKRGVETERYHHSAPGEVPMKRVGPPSRVRTSSATKERKAR